MTQRLLPEFYTIRHVAERLDVPYNTVLDWTAKGLVPVLRIGKRVLVPAQELDELLKRRTSGRRVA